MPSPVIQPAPVLSSEAHFGNVPVAQTERSTFDLSHRYLTTFDAGYLIPMYVREVVPGDTFGVEMSASVLTINPVKRPFPDNGYLETMWFFTPNRLTWNHWVNFMGEKVNPSDSTVYVTPKIDTSAGWTGTPGDLYDYMGVPPGVTGLTLVAFPFRAHHLIWNTWFRDQNFQNSKPVNFASDGPDAPGQYQLYRRRKRKTYLTGALPGPQKGAAVMLPLAGNVPVTFPSPGYGTNVYSPSGPGGTFAGNLQVQDIGTGFGEFRTSNTGSLPPAWADAFIQVAMPTDAYANLGTVNAISVNDMRTALQIQQFLETDNRSGTYYNEKVFAQYGVVNPDARVQRPELLGLGQTRFTMTPIAQTTPTSGTDALGQLGGYLTCNVRGGHGFTYSCTEHGFIIGYMNVRFDLSEQYGLNRMWTRSTQYDYYFPAFAHLGEQVVFDYEIYAAGGSGTWGYQERWAEMRYAENMITGLMRSGVAGSLDIWHMALAYSSLPSLGDAFLQDDPPMDRVIAVPSQPHFAGDLYFHERAARPMPVFSVPGLGSRF